MIYSDIEKVFKKYLQNTKKVSKTTVKNYLCDLRNFLSWLDSQLNSQHGQENSAPTNLRSLKIKLQPKITPEIIKNYKKYLSSSNSAKSTTKRRLSTLHAFCQMGVKKGWFPAIPREIYDSSNSMTTRAGEPDENNTNQTNITLNKFQQYLKKQNLSANTIKNYVADVRKYLQNTNLESTLTQKL